MAWELDGTHSIIEFSVKHMVISTVKGRFAKHSGVLELDEQNPVNSVVDVTIDAASIDTHDANRDGHLRSADFFDVAQFPTITYKSTSIESLGDDKYRVHGDLTMHGVTKPVTLEASLEGHTRGMRGERRAGFSLHTSVSRKEFGLTWNPALETGGAVVSDKVNINIEAEAVEVVTEQAAAPANA